ncbi:MAG TPA: DUF763 domain-containing protein, partial [Sphingobacteriaceae bacterium]
VMGMDWHSSGITTSVMGALKRTVNPVSAELGIYICGGKGKQSRKTPEELTMLARRTGLDGEHLVHCSRLSAKVDNTALQDGFQLYMHNFIVTRDGEWAVVQQGMNAGSTARRYHWHSPGITSFVEDPHAAICGTNQGKVLNLVSSQASPARQAMMEMTSEHPDRMLREARRLVMPDRHDVRAEDVDLKRLGAMLYIAHERQPRDFSELLLLAGMGPRTLQSLALVSEVIYGAPSRFDDPARFSFAHGGKDGHPFPVPVNVYDETITTLRNAVDKAKIGTGDKLQAVRKLGELARQAERGFTPNGNLDAVIEKERNESWKYGGRTVFGKAARPVSPQLDLFAK